MDVMDVKLSQVTTGGNTNWGLRSLAIGRHTVFESVKSRKEAIMAGTLMRALRGDSVGTSGADLNATLTHMTKTKFPDQDPCLWDNRYVVIKELVEHLAKVVQQKGPASANQSMLDQIRQLQRENARLKSGGFSDEAPAEEAPDYADPLETVDSCRPSQHWMPLQYRGDFRSVQQRRSIERRVIIHGSGILRFTLPSPGHPPSVNRPLILPRLSHDLRQEVQILIRRLAEAYPQAVTASGIGELAKTLVEDIVFQVDMRAGTEGLRIFRGVDSIFTQAQAWDHHWLQFFALWWPQNRNFC
ncbi:unnamed protein product [Symbiodinium microadriaticum]|nr:unnamed protein product [Symbiodinium microadriaticum]